jgi:pyrroline-5-carboxylate reductase
MRLAFIGGGTMAEAILGGVLSANLNQPDDISVGEPRKDRCQFLSEHYGVQASTNNLEAAGEADLVVLSIKPQDLPVIFRQLGGKLEKRQAALSIVAGAKMSTLQEGLAHSNIIRVMPNTPAQIGQGMSLWTATDSVPSELRDLTRSILETVGKEIFVDDEKYLDMATALSASGPAYVFLFVEALIDAGVYVGLPRDMARTLALQTVFGSVKLVMDTGKHPGELKDMVVSPGGTTAEGLQALERAGVPAALVDAVNAAYLKSIRLGQG